MKTSGKKNKVFLNTYYVNRIISNKRMTHAELAKEMGISRTTLRTYLQNPEKITISMVNTMAEALGEQFPKELLCEECV